MALKALGLANIFICNLNFIILLFVLCITFSLQDNAFLQSYSTVTLLARFLGLSTSKPFATDT